MHSIELFVGAGGLGMGVDRAGFTPVAVLDFDKWCCETLRQNRKRGRPIAKWPEPIEQNIRDVGFEKYRGRVELVTGGPPCQPFSIGGRHRAHADHRDMWSETVRVIRETEPQAFLFENVKGLARQTFATYLGYITRQLQHPSVERRENEDWRDHLSRLDRHHTSNAPLEYRVIPALVNAANYGVPQKRERVVFVGFREGIAAKWSFPNETHSRTALLWDKWGSGDYWERHAIAKKDREERPSRAKLSRPDDDTGPWRTVRDELAGLPDPERSPEEAAQYLNHRFQPGARTYTGHTGSPLDEPAKTLKAGVHGVPGGENMLRRPDGSVRYFTVRESARLQTFPDNFAVTGSWTESMRQIGNAVPVTLAEVLARSIRDHLPRKPRQHQHAGRRI